VRLRVLDALVAAASRLFADDGRVRVLSGDARDVLPPHGSFELFAGQDNLTWTKAVLSDLANSLLVGTRC
jgi:hypothetical protein